MDAEEIRNASRLSLFAKKRETGGTATLQALSTTGNEGTSPSSSNPPPPPPPRPLHLAVVGGGAAGVAAAWHLVAEATTRKKAKVSSSSPPLSPITPHLTLFEPFGLGAGGTGAAAGLIHPFAPTGKPMWKGAEAFAEAEALVAVAERHRERQEEKRREQAGGGGGLPPLSDDFLSSRSRMLRPAENARQAREFAQRGVQRSGPEGGGGSSATPVGGAEALRVLPGVSLPFVDEDESGGSPISQSSAAAAAALVVEGGLVVDPKAFLRHLWAATVEAAEAAGGSALLDGESPPVRSLAELDRGEGREDGRSRRRFDVVVVAAGAAAGAVAEVGTAGGVGSCELVQGWTATVAPPPPSSSSSSSSSPIPFPESALLGKTYAAPRRRENGSGGAAVVAVGATRSPLPVSAAEALAHCASRGRGGIVEEGRGPGAASEAEEASRELLERFARLWPPAAAAGEGAEEEERERWRVVSATSGVRARPRRSGAGRPPLAGKLESEGENDAGSNWWVIGGLGSRGLLYAAWLGREVARAALADVPFLAGDGGGGDGGQKGEGGGDASLDPELTRWKRWKKL